MFTRRQRHFPLFMEMRLGKTLVVIRRVKTYKALDWKNGRKLRVLVVTESSAIDSWIDELRDEQESWVYCLLGKTRSQRVTALEQAHEAPRRSWTLANKEAHRSVDLAAYYWDVVILDESTFIKNPKAKVTKYFLRNFRKARHRIILTGTPTPEGPENYFCQFAFLFGAFAHCTDFWSFRRRYFFEAAFEWLPKRGALSVIARHVGALSFVMRRKDVGLEKRFIYEKRVLELPDKLRKAYDELDEYFALRWNDEDVLDTKSAGAKFQYARQVAQGIVGDKLVWRGKIDELVSLMRGELKGERVIVWFEFNGCVQAVSEALQKAGVSNAIINGSVSKNARDVRFKRFKKRQTQVLLMQLRVGAYGADLSAASTCVYFDGCSSGQLRTQSEQRILHLEKEEPLLIVDLITKHTVDMDVYQQIKEKGFRQIVMLDVARAAHHRRDDLPF